MKNKSIIKWILSVFIIWRLVLVAIVWFGIKLLPLGPGYVLGGGQKAYLEKPLFWAWANFDGVHYLTIAQKGYLQFQQAFFPFYPLLTRSINNFVHNYLASGLLISHLALIVSLYLLYRLVKMDFNQSIAKRSLIYLLIFPTSFFFGAVYTESIFLAFVLGAFLAARKNKWLLAGVLGALASATRFVGIFLFPALLVAWYLENDVHLSDSKEKIIGRVVRLFSPRLSSGLEKKEKKTKDLGTIAPLFLIFLGLALYMLYLWKTLGDPLYFIHVQPYFGAERTGGKLILPYQVFWRYLRMLVTVEKLTPTYFVVLLESLTGVAFVFLTLFTYLRRWYPYFVFMALAFLTPTLSGTLSSIPRYALMLFPGFILLAIWGEKYQWVRRIYPLISVPLLVVSLWFFSRGFFVS